MGADAGPGGGRLTRRRLLAGGALALGSAGLAGCGGGIERGPLSPAQRGATGGAAYHGPRIHIQFWNGFTGGDGPFMQKLVDRFNAEHDSISVGMVTVRWLEYYSKVPAAVSTGHGPDVAIMHVDQLATFAARGVIVPVDDITRSLGLSRDDFFPQVWDEGRHRGHRYGVPLDTHPLGMYWNTELFAKAGIDEAPQDRRELERALAKLKAKGVQHPFWMPSLWPAHFMFMTLLWQFGGELYNADTTRALFASDAGVEAIAWMRQMIAKGYSPPNVGLDGQYIAFKNGQNAVTWDGIWQINDLAAAPGLKARAAPVPRIGSRRAVWSDSHNFVIPRKGTLDPDRVAAAKTFISWISAHSLGWAKAGQVPARTSVRQSAAFRALRDQSQLARQVPYIHYPPPTPGLPTVQEETLQVAVDAAVRGGDARRTLSSAAEKANRMLADNHRIFDGY
jgi:multiple sugar transport system substrate-binding protein